MARRDTHISQAQTHSIAIKKPTHLSMPYKKRAGEYFSTKKSSQCLWLSRIKCSRREPALGGEQKRQRGKDGG